MNHLSMKNKKLSLASRLKSIGHASDGIYYLVKNEVNAKFHFAATVAAIILGIARHINKNDWLALAIVIGLVWICEAFNTCLELLCDHVCDQKWHPQIKIIKDIAAAAVWISAIISIITGIIVFLC